MSNGSSHRFILVNVVPPVFDQRSGLYDLEELKSLVETYGGATIVRIIQRKRHPDPATYVGRGKAEEITQIIRDEKIDTVVLNAIVPSGQLFELEQMFWKANTNIRVWDRVDLILHIFDKHAQSAEAKLQIDLARMRHMGPRMYGLGGNLLSRQGGGIGTRGLGETNVELMKRHWRDQMKKIEEKLAKVEQDRERKLTRRKDSGFTSVSIVGYTNAGKTTLFNGLTGKHKLAENVLFATLDSHIGKLLHRNRYPEILISDTIGFIQNLPPSLINAFRSTLMESIHADLLLHVIDISDPLKHEKIAVVEEILHKLGIHEKKKLYIFNKADLVSPAVIAELTETYTLFSPQFISAKKHEDVQHIAETITQNVERRT